MSQVDGSVLMREAVKIGGYGKKCSLKYFATPGIAITPKFCNFA